MQYFDLVLSFTALFGLCAFLTLKARLHSALAPLAALGITSIWFTLAGVADLLVAGGWVFYLAAWGLGIFALVTKRSEARRLLSPGAVVFWGLAVSFAVYFSIRQPMFHDFDEFSFWGPAAQMTSTTDHLYTICEYGTPWQATQNCGLIVLSYFVQFFGAFAPFKVYLAYDLLLFACIGMFEHLDITADAGERGADIMRDPGEHLLCLLLVSLLIAFHLPTFSAQLFKMIDDAIHRSKRKRTGELHRCLFPANVADLFLTGHHRQTKTDEQHQQDERNDRDDHTVNRHKTTSRTKEIRCAVHTGSLFYRSFFFKTRTLPI